MMLGIITFSRLLGRHLPHILHCTFLNIHLLLYTFTPARGLSRGDYTIYKAMLQTPATITSLNRGEER